MLLRAAVLRGVAHLKALCTFTEALRDAKREPFARKIDCDPRDV
jgi:hypothetical protein